MSWNDTQTSTSLISADEWNDMVDYIESVIVSSSTIDAATFSINGVEVTATGAELNFVDGVTSDIQTQLNDKYESGSAAVFSGLDLNGYQDMNNNYIREVKTVRFNGEVDNGSSGASDTIDWNAGQKQKSTLSESCTFTFTALTPTGVGNFVLKAINFGAFTPTWPASVLWPGGTEPTWTASGTDIIAFYYDGTNYYGAATLDFS